MNPRLLVLPLAMAGLIAWGVMHRDRAASRISGTIEADEARLASRFGGRVVALFSREGESLTNGQIIAELSAPELSPRKAALTAQLAELVKGPRSEEIEAARRRLESVEAERDHAAVEARRKTALFEARVISDTEKDTATALARSLTAQAAAARAILDELLAGTRPERIDNLKEQIEELTTHERELTVRAPAASRLELLHVKPGDVVGPGSPVATVIFPDYLWLRVYVPEPWLARVSVGGHADLKVDGCENETFGGVIEQVNRRAEFTPRNVQTLDERIKQVFGVKIRIDDPGHKLRPGMSADVTFST